MNRFSNIALFGGSFDPPHIGHKSIVDMALHTLAIDKLFIVPTYLNPFKDSFTADASMRLNWLEKLFEHEAKVQILNYEVLQKRAVPSIETVLHVQTEFNPKKIYFIIGADNYKNLHKWHRYDELKYMVEFVVAHRDAQLLPENLKKLPINVTISSSKLRERMDIDFIPASIQKEVAEYYLKETND